MFWYLVQSVFVFSKFVYPYSALRKECAMYCNTSVLTYQTTRCCMHKPKIRILIAVRTLIENDIVNVPSGAACCTLLCSIVG